MVYVLDNSLWRHIILSDVRLSTLRMFSYINDVVNNEAAINFWLFSSDKEYLYSYTPHVHLSETGDGGGGGGRVLGSNLLFDKISPEIAQKLLEGGGCTLRKSSIALRRQKSLIWSLMFSAQYCSVNFFLQKSFLTGKKFHLDSNVAKKSHQVENEVYPLQLLFLYRTEYSFEMKYV